MLIKAINFLIEIAKDVTPASVLNCLEVSYFRDLIRRFIEMVNKKLVQAKVILLKKELTPFSGQNEQALVADFVSITNSEEYFKTYLLLNGLGVVSPNPRDF